MDIVIGSHSFNAKTLKSITLEKALKSFKSIDRGIVERAWKMANPKGKRKSPKKSKA